MQKAAGFTLRLFEGFVTDELTELLSGHSAQGNPAQCNSTALGGDNHGRQSKVHRI
jgi:hypothetical protein